MLSDLSSQNFQGGSSDAPKYKNGRQLSVEKYGLERSFGKFVPFCFVDDIFACGMHNRSLCNTYPVAVNQVGDLRHDLTELDLLLVAL